MREFDSIDPQTVANDPRMVASTINPDNAKKTFYLLIDEDYAILAMVGYSDYFKKWQHYQLEFPKQGLPWFVDTIEQKFFAHSNDGGLPASKFHVTEKFGEERLKVQRCFGLKNRRETGFDFTTVDRRDPKISKAYAFTDEALFEQGLFDWFKANAEKIRHGQW